MAKSVDSDQTAPIGAVCSGSTLFAFILNWSVMLGNNLQQTPSADDIFRMIFSWRFKGSGIFVACPLSSPLMIKSIYIGFFIYTIYCIFFILIFNR